MTKPTRSAAEQVRVREADTSAWARAHYGPAAEVSEFHQMGGHSGLSYSFVVTAPDVREELVLRVPPHGVRRAANLDVVRFAPVLRLADAGGVPVPSVRWASEDDTWFGTPYLMVSRVEGAPLADVFEPGGSYPDRARVDEVFRQAMNALAAIHALDPKPLLTQGWGTPVDHASDVERWRPLLHKSDDPEQLARTEELGRRLLASAPAPVAPAVVHGDFYSNNWMLDAGRLTAVLDWENAELGDPGCDLGWMSTIYDPECWGPSRAPWMSWHPGRGDFVGWYEEAAGTAVSTIDWYQALMCYRLACITPAKVRLHRTGRRVDPIWETFAEAIPYQLRRGFALIGDL